MQEQHPPIGDLILYNNNQLIALNKPAGMVVQGNREGGKSLLDLAEIYCKHPVRVIHRLDRVVSGVVLMAKNVEAQEAISRQFRERKVQKIYWAVVEDMPEAMEGKLRHYLQRNARINKSFVAEPDQGDGKWAELDYRYLSSSDNYHLLEVRLHTGRHHQIRVQLAEMGCPIKGDVKYGARRGNRDRSIHLHARELHFAHPVTADQEVIRAPLPEDALWKFFAEQEGV